MIRFLGIDYGKKRIGISISDEGGRLAFPKDIISNTKEVLQKIGDIIKKESINEIVVGESLDFSGKDNDIMDEVRSFVTLLQNKFNLPVHLEKEFLTSVEARRYENSNEPTRHTKKVQKKIDASAAALILQRFLDKKNK